MNTTELAEFASLSPTTITRIIKEMETAKTGGVIRRGRAVRVSQNAFMKYMEGRTWKK
jgi:DNA-binding MarR family transcriptional regulator